MFPLRLNPLELLYFNDNRKTRPASFVIQLELSGVPDKALLEKAFAHACRRHPLLGCNVTRGKGWAWHWQPASKAPAIAWGSSNESIDLSKGEKIDLRKQIGLRCWVLTDISSVQDAPKTNVVLQFSHACTDGVGAYRLIGDWLDSYNSLYSGGAPDADLPEIDEGKLVVRYERLKGEIRQRNWFSRFVTALKEGFAIVGPPIRRIHPKKLRNGSPVGSFPGIVSHSFTEDEHKQLKATAAESGFSVNDLLISELFLTISDWNRQNNHKSWSWRKRIRLSLPTDLRNQADYATSASNMTAVAFLTRFVNQLDDKLTLRKSVRQEILKIRDTRRGMNSIVLLDFLAGLPFPAMWLATRSRCCYSAVFSNIGDPARRMLNRFQKEQRKLIAGNLKLELITGVPPMRPDTNLAVSIFTYRRLLTISFRCDPLLFSEQDTRELLTIYTERIRSFVMSKNLPRKEQTVKA